MKCMLEYGYGRGVRLITVRVMNRVRMYTFCSLRSSEDARGSDFIATTGVGRVWDRVSGKGSRFVRLRETAVTC